MIPGVVASQGGSAPASFTYEVFTASGTFSVPAGVSSVSVLLVAAGGGGGTNNGFVNGMGGGGAGGVRLASGVAVTPSGTVAVVVGSGGAGGSGTAAKGGKGGNSSFGAESVEGGGR